MDVRKRQISLVLTGVLFLAGIGWQILVEQTSWLEWLLSLLPGAGFLTLSYISTGTGGIRGRPSASDGWNLAGYLGRRSAF